MSFLVNVKGKSYGAIVLTNTYPDNIKALGKRLGEIMTRAQESGRKKLERYLNLANHELSKRLPKVQQFKLTDCRIVRQKPEGLTVTFKDAVDSTLMTIEHPLGGDPRIVTIHHNDGTQWRILDVGTTATTEANSKSFTD